MIPLMCHEWCQSPTDCELAASVEHFLRGIQLSCLQCLSGSGRAQACKCFFIMELVQIFQGRSTTHTFFDAKKLKQIGLRDVESEEACCTNQSE